MLRADNPPKKFVQVSFTLHLCICCYYSPFRLLALVDIGVGLFQVAAGAKEIDGDSKRMKLFDRERGRVFMHPASVNFGVSHFESGWVVFSDMVETGTHQQQQQGCIAHYCK